jgi:hypothetical protein
VRPAGRTNEKTRLFEAGFKTLCCMILLGGTGLEPATPSVSSGTFHFQLVVLVYLMVNIRLTRRVGS